MREILTPHPRFRSIVIVALLLTLQGISWLVLAVFTFALGIITVRNAAADHKPTAAALTSVFAALGGGFFLIIGLLAFILVWEMRRKNGWFYRGSVMLEGFYCLFLWPLSAMGLSGLSCLRASWQL